MEMGGNEVLEIETQLNALEHEIKNLEHFFMLKDLNKFNEAKNKIIVIQRRIKILTT